MDRGQQKNFFMEFRTSLAQLGQGMRNSVGEIFFWQFLRISKGVEQRAMQIINVIDDTNVRG